MLLMEESDMQLIIKLVTLVNMKIFPATSHESGSFCEKRRNTDKLCFEKLKREQKETGIEITITVESKFLI